MKTTHMFSRSYSALALSVAFTLLLAVPVVSSAAMLPRQLEVGMSGSDVTALQTFLAADSSIYPEGLVTGYFGPLTKSAVMRFQAQHGISQVGRVGPQTLAAIGDLADSGRKVGSDRLAPMLSAVTVSTTNNSATLTWTTSQPAAAIVYYDTAPLRMTEADANTAITVSGMTNLTHTDLQAVHTANLTGLQSNTTYNYLVYVRDASGNVSVTWPATFHTN